MSDEFIVAANVVERRALVHAMPRNFTQQFGVPAYAA